MLLSPEQPKEVWGTITFEFVLSSMIKLLTIALREIIAVPVFYKVLILTNHISEQSSLNLRCNLIYFH